MQDLATALKDPDLQAAYADAEEMSFSGMVDDGIYDVRLDSWDSKEKTQAGSPKVTWDFVIVAGPRKRAHLWKRSNIQPECMGVLKGDIKVATGEALGNISSLPDIMDQLVDGHFKIEKVTKDAVNYPKRYEIRIRERLGKLTAAEAAAYVPKEAVVSPADGKSDTTF